MKHTTDKSTVWNNYIGLNTAEFHWTCGFCNAIIKINDSHICPQWTKLTSAPDLSQFTSQQLLEELLRRTREGER